MKKDKKYIDAQGNAEDNPSSDSSLGIKPKLNERDLQGDSVSIPSADNRGVPGISNGISGRLGLGLQSPSLSELASNPTSIDMDAYRARADELLNGSFGRTYSEKQSRDGGTVPGGTTARPNQQMLDDVINRILNREKFTYDINGDALYQMYRDQYINNGQLAMKDTMGKAAAMTGGYGNSYAQNVGQQAYNGYLQQLNERVPDLYQLAMERYQMEGAQLGDQYDILAGERDYQRQLDNDSYDRELAYVKAMSGGDSSSYKSLTEAQRNDLLHIIETTSDADERKALIEDYVNGHSYVDPAEIYSFANTWSDWTGEPEKEPTYKSIDNGIRADIERIVDSYEDENQRKAAISAYAYSHPDVNTDQIYGYFTDYSATPKKMNDPKPEMYEKAEEAYANGGDAGLNKYLTTLNGYDTDLIRAWIESNVPKKIEVTKNGKTYFISGRNALN